MATKQLDFQVMFDRIGRAYSLYLGGLIRKSKGIDGSAFPPTLRKVKGGKFKKGKRLVLTGKFNQRAFTSEATPKSLRILGSIDKHPDGGTYSDIIYGNDNHSKNQNRRTPSIAGTVHIFPWDADLFLMSYQKAFGSSFLKDIEKEAAKQIADQLRKDIPNKIKVVAHL